MVPQFARALIQNLSKDNQIVELHFHLDASRQWSFHFKVKPRPRNIEDDRGIFAICGGSERRNVTPAIGHKAGLHSAIYVGSVGVCHGALFYHKVSCLQVRTYRTRVLRLLEW